MTTVAVVPIKRNNRRLPHKNTRPFTGGKPLCWYVLSTLLTLPELDRVYVYCSDPDIQTFLPPGVEFLRRSPDLDRDTASMTQVLAAFARDVEAGCYLMTHATAPFIGAASLRRGLEAVRSGEYDSAFAARKVQDFLWKDGRPWNYDPACIPRTQDLPPLYQETSGFYIYTREVITQMGRRVGQRPYLVEVSQIEAVDIDEAEDFRIADALYRCGYLPGQGVE
ncbi:HAD family hydrolase [Faecalibacterium sp. An77]|uniref:acylneuraminate cytidylyltransferase family protein n=1 Tax=unclassified Faecalibacterium TaxID=2646395 RepID=UPI000B37E6FB|nr:MULTISPECIES: acylneuraminate cytidylyltransferase family protein [unclassified Faecalibacterium]OUN37393.1 HAD family hydrolase [Faecalibacterium sp. An77]OUP27222.1 HAD family hydrolase [Faecalibacterium sp. An192]